MDTWLGKIKSYHFQISVTSGKGAKVKRRSVYRKLYKEVEKAVRHIRNELKKHGSVKEAAHLPPSKRERLDKFWGSIENDMNDAEQVMAYSQERIIDEKDTDVEKIVSLSDGSAAFISKGGRETIVGYRPQVGRSGNGFVTVLHVPEGNAGDAPQLEPLVRKVIENTGIAPRCVSTDDGYSSKKGRDAVLEIDGIDIVSISGSKGRDLISEEDWENELYKEARRNRSAVESLIFVLKYSFRFGRLRRRGIEAVREELLEKAIVHNFSRIALMRRRKKILKAG
ncbi:MAG: transposase [Candidatus Aegiribacteria sp.]|nr:transposase [Candidatus Aegiribacteria sp.]